MEEKLDRRLYEFAKFTLNAQFVEEAMRMFIALASGNIQRVAKQENQYFRKTQYSNLEKLSMGQLLTRLKTFLEDEYLLGKLKKLRKERNDIVHNEFLEIVEDMRNIKSVKTKTARLQNAATLAEECFLRLMKHIKSLRV